MVQAQNIKHYEAYLLATHYTENVIKITKNMKMLKWKMSHIFRQKLLPYTRDVCNQ